MPRRDVTKNFIRIRQFSPKLCAKDSFRTVKKGSVKLVICCPRKHWDKRKQECSVGTRAQSILKPR